MRAIGSALALLALPPLFAFATMTDFRLHNRNNGSLMSSGEKRDYLLYVPRTYDHARPTPLVISLHGAVGWPAHQRNLSRWDRVAVRFDAIALVGDDDPIWLRDAF